MKQEKQREMRIASNVEQSQMQFGRKAASQDVNCAADISGYEKRRGGGGSLQSPHASQLAHTAGQSQMMQSHGSGGYLEPGQGISGTGLSDQTLQKSGMKFFLGNQIAQRTFFNPIGGTQVQGFIVQPLKIEQAYAG